MERLIDKIREKYPTPITCMELRQRFSGKGFNRQHYCVAWAGYFYFQDIGQTFKLTDPSSSAWEDITKANDAGNFELAWELLAQAIEGKQ